MTSSREDKDDYAFLDVYTNNVRRGRIIFRLFASDCPYTSKNFLELALMSHGFGYRNTIFHRAVPGSLIQGGRITASVGTRGPSIYGPTFRDENFIHKHTRAGLLSMVNNGRDTNGSEFFITTAPAAHLDGKHVVFGEVIDGYNFVQEIESCGSPSGEVSQVYTVVSCGQMTFAERP